MRISLIAKCLAKETIPELSRCYGCGGRLVLQPTGEINSSCEAPDSHGITNRAIAGRISAWQRVERSERILSEGRTGTASHKVASRHPIEYRIKVHGKTFMESDWQQNQEAIATQHCLQGLGKPSYQMGHARAIVELSTSVQEIPLQELISTTGIDRSVSCLPACGLLHA